MGCDFRFVHCADLHLGSRFWGLAREDPELGRRLFESTFRSFERIVDVGIERSDFMVVAGDVYDEACMTPRTRLFFAEQCQRYGKPVFVVRGNHDFKDTWNGSIPYPDNVTVLGPEPASIVFDANGHRVEVAGMSFPDWHTSENLAVRIRGRQDAFTVGLLHCSVAEAGAGGEYAPCSLADLLGRGVDYWALGHIHKRTVLRESSPAAVYPGNIQGRSPRETGEKGCCVVSVTDGSPSLEFVPTQEVVWRDLEEDITGMAVLTDLLGKIARDAAPGSIVSLSLKGRGALDAPIRADPEGFVTKAEAVSGCRIALSSLKTMPDVDMDLIRNGETLSSEVVRAADRWSAMSDGEILDRLCVGAASNVKGRLRWYADSGRLREMVEAAELSLLDRLGEGSR